MKVVIKSDQKTFCILLPTALLFNRFTATIVTKVIKNKWPSIEISANDIMKLIHSSKEYAKNNKHWELVNISSADGDIVSIRL